MSLRTLNLDEYRPPEIAPSRWACGKSGRRHRRLTLRALVESGFRCVACGATNELTLHHVTRIKGKRDKREIRCVDCHLAAHGRTR